MVITIGNSIKIAKERIKQAFLDFQKLGLAWSGGKDSTTLLILTLEVLRETKGELYVVHNDTLIENPIIRAHCDRVLQELKDYIQKENLPVYIYVATPQPKETFWVNLVGKGYPLPYQKFRWCQRALKIKPSETLMSAIKVPAVLIGIRQNESPERAKVVKKNYQNGVFKKAQRIYLTPLIEWTRYDVWEFLLTFECQWTDLLQVYKLYKDASGECPLLRQTTIEKTACGARFGCWICPLVKEDKSLKNMLTEYPHLQPLLDFRNWLITFCSRPDNRTGKRINGTFLGEGKGQLTLSARKIIFEKLLQMNLLTEKEITEIIKIWAKENKEELSQNSILSWEKRFFQLYKQPFAFT